MEDSGDSWLEDCRLEVHRSGAEVGGQVALEHVAEGGWRPLLLWPRNLNFTTVHHPSARRGHLEIHLRACPSHAWTC